MGSKNTTKRNFNMSDAEMIQVSRVFQRLFVTDKESFIALDADFSDPFAADWLAKIDQATEVAKDVMLKDELAAKTEVVQTVLDNCRKYYMSMKYYIEKAFPDTKSVWNEFGFNDYNKARNSEQRMLQFMTMLHKAALKYTRELSTAGYAEEKIPEIKALYDELLAADNDQEYFKKERSRLTAIRIEVLVNCWEYALKVNKASKTVFASDPAKMESYIISSGSTAEPEEEPEEAMG